jgi:hypothetical protein
VLPTNESGEFRPFQRRLPEEKFWCSARALPPPNDFCNAAIHRRFSVVRGTAVAFCMTLFEVFDIPVFWPILVL